MQILNQMEIVADKAEVLKRLKANREEHARIVQEARVGYIEVAKKKLMAKLSRIQEGRIENVSFALQLPIDNTSVYDTAITMLELDKGDTVKLNHYQVRALIRDQWEWSDTFLRAMSTYSSTAASKLSDAEVDE